MVRLENSNNPLLKGNIFYLLAGDDGEEVEVVALNRDELQHIMECAEELLAE